MKRSNQLILVENWNGASEPHLEFAVLSIWSDEERVKILIILSLLFKV